MPGIRFQCSECGQRLEVPAEASGSPVACPACQAPLIVPSEVDSSSEATAAAVKEVCAICQSPMASEETRARCDSCAAEYHEDCWTENGGCAVYGCSRVPQVEQRRSIEIPISYWGQENKPCPACGFLILAAAVRCRRCGATFASARPEDADAFQERVGRDERLPAMKRNVIVLFICCVLPCLAPIGAVAGLIWYSINRKAVQAMPSVFPALCKIGLAVAIGQCVLLGLFAALFAATQGAQ